MLSMEEVVIGAMLSLEVDSVHWVAGEKKLWMPTDVGQVDSLCGLQCFGMRCAGVGRCW